VDLMLTEPSQVIEAGPGEGEHQRLAPLRKPRRGQVCFDLSCVLIAGSPVSAKRASRKQTYTRPCFPCDLERKLIQWRLLRQFGL
jgi:hypothetical protein